MASQMICVTQMRGQLKQIRGFCFEVAKDYKVLQINVRGGYGSVWVRVVG